VNVTPSSLSLRDLVERGAGDLTRYLDRERVPSSPLEWLGVAVARLPGLIASAHTADDIASRARAGGIRGRLLDALTRELGVAAGVVAQARDRLEERHPHCVGDEAALEVYVELLEVANRSTLRLSETMMASYASFLGGAIEAAGALADAGDGIRDMRAQQLDAALSNTLGGLLAYARLVAGGVTE
jgi:hypothetical protein